jgi:hypothetical protein
MAKTSNKTRKVTKTAAAAKQTKSSEALKAAIEKFGSELTAETIVVAGSSVVAKVGRSRLHVRSYDSPELATAGLPAFRAWLKRHG